MAESLSVVLGDRRYRVERGWGELPDDVPRAAISTVAVDSQGRVYAFRRGRGRHGIPSRHTASRKSG